MGTGSSLSDGPFLKRDASSADPPGTLFRSPALPLLSRFSKLLLAAALPLNRLSDCWVAFSTVSSLSTRAMLHYSRIFQNMVKSRGSFYAGVVVIGLSRYVQIGVLIAEEQTYHVTTLLAVRRRLPILCYVQDEGEQFWVGNVYLGKMASLDDC